MKQKKQALEILLFFNRNTPTPICSDDLFSELLAQFQSFERLADSQENGNG